MARMESRLFGVPLTALSCWFGSHVRAFNFYGGVPKTVIIDSLKTGVTIPCRYDPVINRSYQELAEHCGVAVLAARSRKPRDEAKVEKAIQDIERWVLAPLRDRVFHSIAEVHEAMAPLLEALNNRTLRGYGESPKGRFNKFSVVRCSFGFLGETSRFLLLRAQLVPALARARPEAARSRPRGLLRHETLRH
jgi:hypothetical protein